MKPGEPVDLRRPLPPATASSIGTSPASVTHRSVSANGIRFHLASAGTGPLVLMLHGFGGLWMNWRNQLPDLAEAGHHAVAADLRGSGDSDKPPRGI